jgi:ribonuclease G
LPEWLIERGIGETRAALVDSGEIIEARFQLEGSVPAGSVIAARVLSTGTSGRNAVAIAQGGAEYLIPNGAPGATQGSTITVEVTREAIPGSEPWKRPLAKVSSAKGSIADPLKGRELIFPAPTDHLGGVGWNDLLDEGRSGVVRFAGGELRIAPTPAMTLIDVDGFLDAGKLSVIGAVEAARAIRRLDIGGSIGIDLPTIAGKAARQSAAAAIDDNLPQPFERTAVNGFGFLQIVRPRRRASLIELAQDRPSFEARALLRRTALELPGPKRLVANPAVISVLSHHSQWLQSLSRQIGGAVELRGDGSIPMSGGYAEIL